MLDTTELLLDLEVEKKIVWDVHEMGNFRVSKIQIIGVLLIAVLSKIEIQ